MVVTITNSIRVANANMFLTPDVIIYYVLCKHYCYLSIVAVNHSLILVFVLVFALNQTNLTFIICATASNVVSNATQMLVAK